MQAAADNLSASTIEKRLNYWTWLLGPKFSENDRKAVHLKQNYRSIRSNIATTFSSGTFPSTRFFEHSCEMGLFRLTAD